MGEVFISEIFATAMLTLLGCGVVANAILPKQKGYDGGWLLINFGWGLAVFAAVYVGFMSGAHLNPAVTLGILASGADGYGGTANVPVNFVNTVGYIVAELIGAYIGAVLAWLANKQHFDEDAGDGVKLGVFATGPQIRNYSWNMVTEVIATFVLVFVILVFGGSPSGLGPLAVALLVVVIGNSLGGPTGYAINPARDLGPRIAHATLPIPNKGSSDWAYSWVPIAGPIIGGVLGGVLAKAFFIPELPIG